MDWFEYENVQMSLQRKHAKMIRELTKKKEYICKWIQPGNQIEINGFILKKGYFYIGDYFVIPKSDKNNYNESILLGPLIQENLPVENGILTIIPFSSYWDMHPTHRHEYLSWLSGEKNVSEVSLSTLVFYLFGLQLRMFWDETTDDKERIDIIFYSLELYIQCIEYNIQFLELELFINASICYYFKGKEREILNHSGEKDSSILYRLCYFIVKGLKTKYAIPHQLISKYFINQLSLFVDSEIKNLLNSIETITDLGSYFSSSYTISQTSGENLKSLFCYDFDLNIRLKENYQLCYSIDKCVKQFCKNTSAKLKEYQLLQKISPELSYFALPASFSILDFPNAISFEEKIKYLTESQEYSKISVNYILGLNENFKKRDKKIEKPAIIAIIKCIKKMGYGIIPNILVDDTRFNYGDDCIIYREKEEIELDYILLCQMESILKVCVYIVGESHNEYDMSIIDNFIENEVRYVSNQRYLMAYLRWLFLTCSYNITQKDKSNITELSENKVKRIVVTLISLISSNNQFISKRIDCLRHVLPLFNMDQQIIHTIIHRISIGDEEFATIEKENRSTEYIIDKVVPGHRSVSLSNERLAKIEKQTRQAQDLLSDIFEDNGDSTKSTVYENKVFLDILKILLSKELWKRDEVENLCKKFNIMIGSALEQINDYSYSKIEDAVIDDDGDTIYVMTEYKEKLI